MWTRDLRFALRVMACDARRQIQIDGAWEEDGLLWLDSQTSDVVLQGLLRKTRSRAKSTCMECGRPGKLRQITQWNQATLCARCAAPRLLKLEIRRLLALDDCGTANLQEEIIQSPDAVLLRAAAQVAAVPCGSDDVLAAGDATTASLRGWLTRLLDRAELGCA